MAEGDILAVFKNRPRNPIINGAFDIWQRASAFSFLSGADAYTADRWKTLSDFTGVGKIAPERIALTGAGSNQKSKYAMQVKELVADATAIVTYGIEQKIEVQDARRFNGREVTLSFLMRSWAAGTHAVRLTITGELAITVPVEMLLSGVYEKKTITVTLPEGDFSGLTDVETGMRIFIGLRASGVGMDSIPFGNSFQIAQVMLNLGPAPAEFERAGVDSEGEISKCQRYYEKSYLLDVVPATITGVGNFQISARSDGASTGVLAFGAQKRVLPTMTGYNPLTGAVGTWQATGQSIDFTDTGTRSVSLSQNSGTASNQNFSCHWTADAEL